MGKQKGITPIDEKTKVSEAKEDNQLVKNPNNSTHSASAFFKAEGDMEVDVEHAVVIEKGHFGCHCKMKCNIL